MARKWKWRVLYRIGTCSHRSSINGVELVEFWSEICPAWSWNASTYAPCSMLKNCHLEWQWNMFGGINVSPIFVWKRGVSSWALFKFQLEGNEKRGVEQKWRRYIKSIRSVHYGHSRIFTSCEWNRQLLQTFTRRFTESVKWLGGFKSCLFVKLWEATSSWQQTRFQIQGL